MINKCRIEVVNKKRRKTKGVRNSIEKGTNEGRREKWKKRKKKKIDGTAGEKLKSFSEEDDSCELKYLVDAQHAVING